MDKRTLDFGDCMEVGSQQYALNLYTLAESIKAMTVLEIGAGWGWSARAFAMSLAHRHGRIISIDPHPERIKPENRGRIFALDVPWDVRTERSGQLMVNDPLPETFDLVYIDGDPRNAASDFNFYLGNVRDGGLIVLDGYGGQPGPTEFIEAAEQERSFLLLPYSDAYCHAIYRKPVPHAQDGKYEAHCTQCPKTFSATYWSGLDESIDAHVTQFNHSVEAYAGPRRLKYTKGVR